MWCGHGSPITISVSVAGKGTVDIYPGSRNIYTGSIVGKGCQLIATIVSCNADNVCVGCVEIAGIYCLEVVIIFVVSGSGNEDASLVCEVLDRIKECLVKFSVSSKACVDDMCSIVSGKIDSFFDLIGVDSTGGTAAHISDFYCHDFGGRINPHDSYGVIRFCRDGPSDMGSVLVVSFYIDRCFGLRIYAVALG